MKPNLSDYTPLQFWMTALLVCALGFALWTAGHMVVLVLTAVVLSLFIESMAGYLTKIGMPRPVAIVVVFILIFVILGLLLVSAVPVFVREIGALKSFLPEGDQIEKFLKLFSTGTGGSSHFTVSPDAVMQVTNGAKGTASSIFKLAVSTFGGLANLVLLSMLSLYLALEDRAVERLIRATAPRSRELYILSLWQRVREKTEGWFKSQLVVAAIVSVLSFTGLLLLGVPYALLLALLGGVIGIIPFGIIVAFLPALGIAFAHGGVLTPVYVTILYGCIQYLTDYIIQPILTKRTTGLPPLLVIISLVLSVTLFGFMGFFLAIPGALFLLELVRDMEREKIAEREMSNTVQTSDTPFDNLETNIDYTSYDSTSQNHYSENTNTLF